MFKDFLGIEHGAFKCLFAFLIGLGFKLEPADFLAQIVVIIRQSGHCFGHLFKETINLANIKAAKFDLETLLLNIQRLGP